MYTLPVIKIEMAGSVTSFRYPHFTQGVHPTFEMPPPSTIYGHICGAVGDWLPAERLRTLRFGYHFTHQGKFVDYKEHLHFGDPIQPFPFDREMLFNPRLTLYLTDLDLIEAFRQPYYAVILGRSQDLMTYQSVEIIDLHPAEAGYFEHTLLPLYMAPRLEVGTIAVTMARYINERRQPTWGSYALLNKAAVYPPPAVEIEEEEEMPLRFADAEVPPLWVDPTSPDHRKYPGLKRFVWLHSFMED